VTYQVVLTKPFANDLKTLHQQGNRKIVQAARAAVTEAGTHGEIRSLARTKHGESRIPNVEKYDLGAGCRLVVQLVDGVKKTRAFLFIGSHDQAEHWLDVHRNYQWVQNKNDGVLDFVLVTGPAVHRHVPADRLNLDAPEATLEQPILGRLSEEDWQLLALDSETRSVLEAISGSAFEQDAQSILEKLDEIAGYDNASLLFDLMSHAHAGQWPQLRKRLELLRGEAVVLDSDAVAVSMSSPDNSEAFITFDDHGLLDEFFTKGTVADWMLFLHPGQKAVAERELRGPARLRGVSGSGKTCVLVHRARNLAKKYQQPIALVTLTESMRKLLERLVDDLCGVERTFITVKTMSMLAKDTLLDCDRQGPLLTPAYSETVDAAAKVAEAFVRQHQDFDRSVFGAMGYSHMQEFLRSEFAYVRGRLTESNLPTYLDAKVFQRRGRGTALAQSDRRIVLDAITVYQDALAQQHMQDHEGYVSMVIEAISQPSYGAGKFRCILSDEVQDLSECDIALMGRLKTPDGHLISKAVDGLFLAGDGAQSIYKRGFTLRRIGIDISGRSFSLKKNYRNTHEILKAAFGLVAQYEFADVDEENIERPSLPDFAETHGAKPLLVRCSRPEDEVAYVAGQIYSSLAMGQLPGQICVIGPSQRMRAEMEQALKLKGIATAELRHDVDYESDHVKISTIESAKGHEFSAVYIVGLVEGALPATGIEEDGLPREASRLYVAMTRARERLTLTYSHRQGSSASRFLSAIQKDCDEGHVRNGELRPVA